MTVASTPTPEEWGPEEWGKEVGRAVNGMLHDALGLSPCDTACDHVLAVTPRQGQWTALGVANCVARIVGVLEDPWWRR